MINVLQFTNENVKHHKVVCVDEDHSVKHYCVDRDHNVWQFTHANVKYSKVVCVDEDHNVKHYCVDRDHNVWQTRTGKC